MLNARTWHRLCISAYVMFPAMVITWLLPNDSPFIWAARVAIVWSFFVGAIGALQGIMLACGKLHLGCPLCDAKSFVSGGDREGVYLDCPHCGELRLKVGRLFGLQAIRPGSVEDDLAECQASPGSPLLAPKRHLIPFAIIFLPVVASVVAASMIHKFSFFYILIPGFWCYAVGGFILEGIFSGSVSDNHGTAVRRRSPIRFWGKIGIWSLFYIFAAAFPIGFAMQESGKQKTTSEQDGGGQPATRPDSK
jgi:hypothetical protein